MNSSEIARLHATVSADTTQAERNLTNFRSEVTGAGRAAQTSSKGLNVLAGAAGALGAIISVQQIANWTGEVAQMAEEAKKTSLALDTLSGGQATASINAMTEALDGSVSKMGAAKTAAALFATNVADTAQEAAHFAEVAATLGSTVGTDVATSIENLRLAIDNVSYDRLGELGIAADAVRTRVEELKKSGMSLGEAFKTATLEIAEQRFRELNEAGVEVGTSTDRLTSKWTDFSVAMGAMVEPSISGVKDALAELLGVAATSLEETNQRTAETADAQSLLRDAMAETGIALTDIDRLNQIYRDGLGGTVYQTDAATAAQQGATVSAYELAQAFIDNAVAQGMTQEAAALLFDGLTDLDIAQQMVGDSGIDAKNGALTAAGGMDEAGDAALVNAAKVWAFKDALDAVAARQMGISTPTRIDPRQWREDRDEKFSEQSGLDATFAPTPQYIIDRANRLNDLYEQMNDVQWEYGQGWVSTEAKVTRAGVGSSNAISAAARKAAREQEKLARDIQRAYEQAYNEIYSTVQRTMSFQGGVQEFDDLLDRTGVGRVENESNEIIRRLEDVRNQALEGKRSPWLEKFLGLDNENLEVVAANAERRIRDLQMGIYDSLSSADIEGLKADTLRQIEIDRKAEELQRSIAQSIMDSGAASGSEVNEALKGVFGDGAIAVGGEIGSTAANDIATSFRVGIEGKLTEASAAGAAFGKAFSDAVVNETNDLGARVMDKFWSGIDTAVGA